MKRNEWQFNFAVSELIEPTQKKIDAHTAKLKWWENKKAEVMQKVRESGIEIHDSVAASYSNTKGGFGPEIKIDVTMQRDLSECQQKIMEHSLLLKTYQGWLELFKHNPNNRLELHADDWLFFFGE